MRSTPNPIPNPNPNPNPHPHPYPYPTPNQVLAAIPGLRETYFAPTTFKGPMQQPVQVIGLTLTLTLPPTLTTHHSPSTLTTHHSPLNLYPTPNQVIGRTQEQHGVAEPERLVQLMRDGFTQGLGLNHSPKAHVIVLIQLRWDNMP